MTSECSVVCNLDWEIGKQCRPDQTPQNAKSDLGLHCILKISQFNWPFRSGDEVQNSDGDCGGRLGFPIGTIAIFDLQDIILLSSYQVSSQLAFRFRGSSKEIIKMAAGRHLRFPVRISFAVFDLQVPPPPPPKTSCLVSSQLTFLFRRSSK